MKSIKVKDSKGAVDAMKLIAPDAPNPENMPEGAPNAGARQLPGKAIPANGEGNYRFSTTTPVTTAKEVVGAHAASIKLQEGTNASHLPKASPPNASSLKDGDPETYQTTLIGTP